MSKRLRKPEFIPVEWLFLQKGFTRNYKMLKPEDDVKAMIEDALIANAVANVETKESQRRKSVRPRPKKNDRGDTRDGLIEKLARQRPGEGPSELWVHFKTELEEWSEGEAHETGKGDSRSYQYERGEEKQRIGFRAFREKVSVFRKESGI